MKIILYAITTILLVSSSGGQPESKAEIFHVSKTGNDKTRLMKVFEAVSRQELVSQIPPPIFLKTSQKIDDHNYLVYWKDLTYWLILENPQDLADDSGIVIHGCEDKRTKEYISVLGAKKTVGVVREIKFSEPKAMAKEEFSERLKKGETWTLKEFSVKPCAVCFGDGKLSVLNDYSICHDCNGNGEFKNDLLVKW
jgi:hypothetical protein